MDLLRKPYFSVGKVNMESEDLRPGAEKDNGNSKGRMKSPIPLYDADDSGFSECCSVAECQDHHPRLCRRNSLQNEFLPEVVYWEPPLRGSSTPHRNESSVGGGLQSNLDQSQFTMVAGTEVLEIDLRRKYVGLGEQKQPPATGTNLLTPCPNARPWCIEAPFADSRFDHCLNNRHIPCLKGTPTVNQRGNEDRSLIKHDTDHMKGVYTGYERSVGLREWQDQFLRRNVGHIGEKRLHAITPKYFKMLTEVDFYKGSKHDEIASKQTAEPPYINPARVPGVYSNNFHDGRLNEFSLNCKQQIQDECGVDLNNNIKHTADNNTMLHQHTLPRNELPYQKQTLFDDSYTINNANESDSKTNMHSHHSYMYLTGPGPTTQEDSLDSSIPLIKLESNLSDSYRNIYSDVSDEEHDHLTKHRKENPSDGTDTDSTNEPVSPPYCSSSYGTPKFDTEELPVLRRKVRRKMSTPRRSAEKRDPRFRGVTMWLQTEFKNGRSNLQISAFYSNVKSGCKTTNYHQPCQPVITSPEQYSCSDAEGHSPHHCVKVCASCRTRRTPLWRDAEDGTPLCNACGIRYKKYRLRCSKCWHIPKKEIKTYPNCPICGGSLRYSFHNRKTW